MHTNLNNIIRLS